MTMPLETAAEYLVTLEIWNLAAEMRSSAMRAEAKRTDQAYPIEGYPPADDFIPAAVNRLREMRALVMSELASPPKP